MKQQFDFHTTLQRRNMFKEFFYRLFLGLASYPRMVLEVVIRRDFGERYFTLASAITVLVIMLAIPFASAMTSAFLGQFFFFRSHGETDFLTALWQYSLWYVFILWFGYQSWLRWKEIRRTPGIFDISRYSRSSGYIHPFFFRLKLFGKPLTIRQIEIFAEPGLFLILGILLMFIGQKLGVLFVVCSIFYGFSYAAAYKEGDDFIMDILDKKIIGEELDKAINRGPDYVPGRGVRWRMTMPTSDELRNEALGEILKVMDESGPAFAI